MIRVLLYGTSIFLAGLAARLRSTPEIEVFCRADLSGLVNLGEIDAVVVDPNDILAADVWTMIRARPDVKIISVNADNNAVTVLSGNVYLARAVDDVVAFVARLGQAGK